MAYERFAIIAEGRKIPNVSVDLVDEPHNMNMDQWRVKDGEVSRRLTVRDEFIREHAIDEDNKGRKVQHYNLI